MHALRTHALCILPLSLWQIYLQGLLIQCHDEGVLYSRLLEEAVILEAIEFADRHAVTLTGGWGGVVVVCVCGGGGGQ